MLHKVTFWVEGETVDIKMGKTKKKKKEEEISSLLNINICLYESDLVCCKQGEVR